MLFDSHAHYDDEKFDDVRDEILSKMSEYGVKRIVNAGASIKGSYSSRELSHKYDFMYFTAGIHPESAFDDMQDSIGFQKSKICAVTKNVSLSVK